MGPNIMRNIGAHMTDIQKYTKRTILNIFFLYSSVVVNILLLGLIITSMVKQFKNPDFKEKGIHPVILEDVTILPSCIFTMENSVRHHLILFNKTFSHCNGIKFSYFYDAGIIPLYLLYLNLP